MMRSQRNQLSVRSRNCTAVSQWVRLVEKEVGDQHGHGVGKYHSLDVADYVSVLAVTREGQIPLVRQFRPAVERETLEFPGGLLDEGEQPATCAARELAEEAGQRANQITLIGTILPDAGRLGNRMWCFFTADIAPIANWNAEFGVETVFVTPVELSRLIASGQFDHAPHLALYTLACSHGLFPSTTSA
jgi:8-oxo-dGTP pyrophosphatase MutT (NUDIX family)